MERNTLFLATAVAIGCFTLSAKAQEPIEHSGDPARWYEPANTPQKKYEALKKEAGAALKEARDECRRAADRRACDAEARAQYTSDMQAARAYLAGDIPLANTAR